MNAINRLLGLGLFLGSSLLAGCAGCSDGAAGGGGADPASFDPDGGTSATVDGGEAPDAGSSDAAAANEGGATDGGSEGDATSDAELDAGDAGPDADTSVTSAYVYDDQQRLLGIYDAFGNALQEIVYLDDRPIALLRDGKAYGIQTDQLGAPRAIVASSSAAVDAGDPDASPDAAAPPGASVVWRWEPEPFGSTPPDEDPDGDGVKFVFHERFPGQRFDPISGLFQNHHRNYSAETGRYVEPDPIGLLGGFNLYAYVDGNPVSKIDRLGLQASVAACRTFNGQSSNQQMHRKCTNAGLDYPGKQQQCDDYFKQRRAACDIPPPPGPPVQTPCTRNCGNGRSSDPPPPPPPPPKKDPCAGGIVGDKSYADRCT